MILFDKSNAPATPAPSLNAVVGLYCEDLGAKTRIQQFLRRHVDFVDLLSLQALVGLTREVSCTVIGIGRTSQLGSTNCAAIIRKRHPRHPIVLVTIDHGAAHWFTQVPGDDVVRLPDVERDLGPAIGRACLNGFLERLASDVEAAKAVPPSLRAALALTYRARPPIRSVKELAARIGCQPRTLEHHWRRTVVRGEGLRLHDLLSWVLLLHATTERLKKMNWAAVAEELGVSSQTLARLGKTLADLSLREISALGHRATLPLFRQRVLDALPADDPLRCRA